MIARRLKSIVATLGLATGTMLLSMVEVKADETITIGVMAPYTGPSALTGEQFRDAFEFAVEDARNEGELPVEIDGIAHDIEAVWIDEEASPEKAVKAVQQALRRDGIEILTGGWHSSVGIAVFDVMLREDVLSWAILPATVEISNKINENNTTHWFKGWPAIGALAELYPVVLEDLIASGRWVPATKNAAIVVEDTDWGHGWGEAITAKLIENGWSIVSSDVVQLDATEHSALLTKYKAGAVSLVATTISSSATLSALIKQHSDLDVGGILIADGAGWYPDFYEMTGDALNLAIAMDSPRTITPEQKSWSERYEERFGYPASPAPAGLVYDYTRMLIKGINEAGTLDVEKLSEVLLDTEYDGIWQHYAFAKEAGDGAVAHHEVKTGPFMQGFSFPMTQYLDGEAKIIWPYEHAEAEFVAPN